MQDFHAKSAPRYENRNEYTNRTRVAVDWPQQFECVGRTFSVELTGTSKSFPAHVTPTNIWLSISSGQIALTYFVATSAPSWSYIETFIGQTSLTETERAELESRFLNLSTYQEVEVHDWQGGSIEEHWSRGRAYDAKKAQLEADAEEREMYGGKTWQEYHDDL